nr:HAMP domain-containing protein [Dissulfurirhabdus thermomarina]
MKGRGPWGGRPRTLLVGALGRAGAAFWAVADSVPIRVKIIGMVLGTACLVGSFATVHVYRVMSRQVSEHLREMSRAVAGELSAHAGDFILVNDIYGLDRLLREARANRPDLRYAFVLDPGGQVLVHTFEGGFPHDLLRVRHRAKDAGTIRFLTNEGSVWDTAVPISGGAAGILRVGISERRSRAVIHFLVRDLLLTTLLVMAGGVLLSGLLTWVLTRPLKSLAEAARRIQVGDYSARVREFSRDEAGRLISAFNEMAERLEAAEAERAGREALRRELMGRVLVAQEEERARIARELHDQVGQSIASLMVELKVLQGVAGCEAARAGVERLRHTLTRELEGIHRLSVELRPPVLDDLGLAAALDLYVTEFMEQHGIEVDFTPIGVEEGRLPAPVEIGVYRIIQEALTNVVRHAEARRVTVILERRAGRIRGVVEDDGTGFVPGKVRGGRVGLYGMEERAQLLGGRLHVDSEPGRGTMVVLDVPLPGGAG